MYLSPDINAPQIYRVGNGYDDDPRVVVGERYVTLEDYKRLLTTINQLQDSVILRSNPHGFLKGAVDAVSDYYPGMKLDD